MDKHENLSSISASTECTRIKAHRSPQFRRIQNFLLVFLDENIDESNNSYDYHNIINQLQEIVMNINTFTVIDKCLDFVTNVEEETVFMIVSGLFSQIVIPVVQKIDKISCIYIFCTNKTEHEKWSQEYSKVKGAFTDITSIGEALKQNIVRHNQNAIPMSFINTISIDETSKTNLEQLDQSFMYTQLLKEILITIPFDQIHLKKFLDYYRKEFVRNDTELTKIAKIENEYSNHSPIWWYTSDSFLYPMVNQALRTMEAGLIVTMGFFIRDVHQQIAELHSKQFIECHCSNPFTVYRGQGLSKEDFEQLIKTKGGLMSFNNFLSTSVDSSIAEMYAESNATDSQLIGILFRMNVDPSKSSTVFAKVRSVSYFREENEILFSMHAIFRIMEIKKNESNDRLYHVDLTLTDDNDRELSALTDYIREETKGRTGWIRLSRLMVNLSQYDKAEELYNVLLEQTTDEGEKHHLYYMLGVIKNKQGQYEEAIKFFQAALDICNKLPSLPADMLATSSCGIGQAYVNMGEYSKALSNYETALEIYHKIPPANDPKLAACYASYGAVYETLYEYSKALSYYEKAIEIDQKTLPANHPDLARSYNNISIVYSKNAEYSKALLYCDKALEIYQKSLPPNHPDFITTYANIGTNYHKMTDYPKALSYFEKVHEIIGKICSSNHPDLAFSYMSMGTAYDNMGDHPEALLYFEKALHIRQKFLSPNHPDLAQCYSWHGSAYDNMGNYDKALECFKKTLEIQTVALCINHPDLGNTYNNIGTTYNKIGDYSEALPYLEKALEIRQASLRSDHPDIDISYNNIAVVYYMMNEYSKSLAYFEKSLEIRQKVLSSDHPQLIISYYTIADIYSKMKDYSKELSYIERIFEILQNSRPQDDPDLLAFQMHIDSIKKKLQLTDS
ncbi:unnamed protein product [Adineta ricciae]|uniref:ADP ribosyltransferase domain-containing protein n=1 Tax=Adineta ricciae TaxID=249248 RepID=A0A815DIR2_ADIRI|nr:unnamed protein product [Adineta ricciae]CAF1635122.1 unnamed protein product [Adineta ricciae]